MPMFTGGQQIVTGGTFVQTSTSKGFKILHGKIAADAFHNSGERFDPPKCYPNTREAILAEIMHWIEVIEQSEDVLWLYGSAGAGKSAIAQSIAEKCAQMKLLIASFFFSRASQTRNNEKRLIASIAYQLAISIPTTRSYIESAVQNDPAIFDKSLETQIETLIIRTLESACADVDQADAKQWARLIIIDGLDECNGTEIQCSIIRLLSAALRRVPFPLILLVASRPEPDIRNAFNLLVKSAPHTSRHIVLDDSYEPDKDIRVFLVGRFTEIKENHPVGAYIPECWPSEKIVDQLVRKSSGQFIYPSTVMKYLDSRKHRPMKRLDVIMGLIPVVGDMPYKELDALYSHIFSCVEDFGITLKILGYLFFGFHLTYFTPKFLALLLGLDEEDIYLHLSELHSILDIPPPPNTSGSRIRPVHASLRDFLVDNLRSGKYYLDEEAFHTDLARQCIRHISTLSVKQGSKSGFSREGYLTFTFIYHCSRASTNSASLKTDLMQLCDLRPWLMQSTSYFEDWPSLFEWLYKADDTKELFKHVQSLWDQYLTTKLSEYKFNGSNVDIAGLLVFPDEWHSRWLSLISGTLQVPEFFGTYLPEYQDFLAEFFEDKTRSGKYHVDGTVYAYAALECLLNMVNLNDDEIFNPYPFIVSGIDRPDAKLFMSITEGMNSQPRDALVPGYYSGLHAVRRLLLKAAPLDDLFFYLRDHPLQNPAKAKVHWEHGFGELRRAVRIYLEKCKHLVPKVLRRSASFPLASPHVLDIDRAAGSAFERQKFNHRWPLKRDRSGFGGRKADLLSKTRALPEMVALQSVGKKRGIAFNLTGR